MKQTQMYVCTLEEFILVDVVTLLYMDEVRDMDWNPHWFIYKCNNRRERMRLLSDVQLTLRSE